MGYKMDVSGINELIAKLDQAGKSAEKVASKALYKGAGKAADSIRKEANSIRTKKFKYAKDGVQRDPSPEEKAAITSRNSIGISKFKNTGNEINTSVGYNMSGYTTIAGKQKPVALIANSINHGTSFMKKQPFIRKSKAQSKANEVIEQELAKEVEELLKD